ncbi:hypothetical protein [Coleofasciculus sp. G2-EDA-02]|uniref:hypothetical protein n=1 Tax=Coleofasciculus sp. G2-EDA-02 TaxID=3069529 RepID=UPI0032F86C32
MGYSSELGNPTFTAFPSIYYSRLFAYFTNKLHSFFQLINIRPGGAAMSVFSILAITTAKNVAIALRISTTKLTFSL